MEDINTLLDLPSPTHSAHYMYADGEQYLDANTSESQSPENSLYDMPYIPELGLSNVYPSPERDDEESPATAQTKPAVKRKRENRYKNAPPSVLSRRRAQNRASQRAYRERKDQRIKDLETMLNDAKQRNEVLTQAYATLHAEYVSLKASQADDHQHHHGHSSSSSEASSSPYLPRLAGLHAPHYQQDLSAAGVFDPTMGMANNDRIDLDLFVYSDMTTGYPL